MIDNEFSGKVDAEEFRVVTVAAAETIDQITAERDSLRLQLDAMELSRRSWMDEAKSLEAIVGEMKSLLLEANELFYSVEGELSALSAQEVDAMRGKVFTSLKSRSAPVSVLSGGRQAGKSHLGAQLESLAQQIYDSWQTQPGWVPWSSAGPSQKKIEARAMASRVFELALANQVGGES